MDDLSAPRIEALAHGNVLDEKSPKKVLQPKKEVAAKHLPSPSIDSDEDPEVHQIDELA